MSKSLRDIRTLSAVELDNLARAAFGEAAEKHLAMGHVIVGTMGDGSTQLFQMARIHGADIAWPYTPGTSPK